MPNTTVSVKENLTREETCEILRCGMTKLWALEQEGSLKPSFRLGRRVIYRKADIDRFCDRLARRAAKSAGL